MNANFAMFGDALNRTGGTMTGSLTVNNVLPEADNTRDLGSAALSFNDAWFDGTVTMGTLALTTLTCTGCVDAPQLASTTVTAAAYGSASGVATFTVDADGRLTTAATTAIAIATSQVTSGNYVATVTAGSGIAVGTGTGTGSTPAFSLTALTADWTQSGAYDIILSNAGAEIQIKESAGDTFYGVLEVGDLAGDAIYTFSGLSGTVLTSVTAAGGDVSGTYSALVVGNDSHTHDAANLTGTTLATGVVTTSITSTGTVASGTWSASFGNAAVSSVAGGTYAGDDSIATVGTITAGVWNAGAVTSTGALTSTLASGNALVLTTASVGANINGLITNTDNTNSSSSASLSIITGGASGGNPYLYLSTGAQEWTVGVNNADSDSFNIGHGSVPSANTALKIGTDKAATFYGVITSAVSVALTGTTNNVGTITSGVWNAGAVTSSGVLTVNGFGTHTFSAGGTGANILKIANTTAGTGNYGHLIIAADASAGTTNIYQTSSSFTASGINPQNGTVMNLDGAGGVSIAATHASGAIRFYSGGTSERMRIETDGSIYMYALAAPGTVAGSVCIAATGQLFYKAGANCF